MVVSSRVASVVGTRQRCCLQLLKASTESMCLREVMVAMVTMVSMAVVVLVEWCRAGKSNTP